MKYLFLTSSKTHMDLLAFNILLVCIFINFYASNAGFFNTNLASTGHQFKLGNCPSATFYEKERVCLQTFFESVRVNRMITPNCSASYLTLRQCMIEAYKGCIMGSPLEPFIRDEENAALKNFLTFLGNQSRWCKDGGLAAPTHLYKGTVCHSIFQYVSMDCVYRYHKAFNSTTPSNKLCREYQQAKTCLFRNLVNHCDFNPRPLKQMVEEMVSAQFHYQPFCTRNAKSRTHSYNDLVKQQTCPPQAHADVMFVVDASGETSRAEFRSMKQTIANITKRLNLGRAGTRIGVIQFHERFVVSIRLNRFLARKSFLRRLSKLGKIRTKRSSRRFAGQALRYLATGQFNIGEESTIIRHYHTPIVVLLTTGSSDDNIQSAVNELKSKNVHLIRLGPSFRYGEAINDVTYHVSDTTNYSQHSNDILREICKADREYRSSDPLHSGPITENSRNGIRQPRLPLSNLPLLWIPTRLSTVSFLPESSSTSDYSQERLSSSFDNSIPLDYDHADDPFFNIGEGV